MKNIWLTSDLHLGHDREFIYKPRGFNSIQEHDETIIERFNNLVNPNDQVYILGDLMLGDNEHGLEYLRRLNGEITVIRGNHDTDNRVQLYLNEVPSIREVADAKYLRYNGYHFFLCHYPTMTANLEKESLKQQTLCLYGHTHQCSSFFNDIPGCYHVGLDSHNCYPVFIDIIIEEMKNKIEECKSYL